MIDGRPSHRSAYAIESFQPRHVSAASELVAAGFRRAIAGTPSLPPAQGRPETHIDSLERLADGGTGAVAIRNGELAGFQAAWVLGEGGGHWTYCRDDGHAAINDDREVIEALYTRLAADWVAAGHLDHVVTASAADPVTLETYSRLGFGVHAVDLVRDLSSVLVASRPAITIRAGGVDDIEDLIALEDGLRAHLAASPVFQPGPPRPRTEQLRRLADPAAPIFLARDEDGRCIAHLRIGPCATDVAMIVRDPATASITGAFTVPGRRGEDVASALLDHAIRWARDHGYARCAVDHESANLEAVRFWGRHFTTVALSLVRRIRTLD